MAFQIVDDLLDAGGDAELMGKQTQQDAKHGKLTYPGLIGIEQSRSQAETLVAQACSGLAPLGPAAERLAALAHYVLDRRK
jgi:geranylgeranyl pyrophosphate synthase